MTRALAAALLLAWAVPARAAEPAPAAAADAAAVAEARARFRRGVELYGEKRWREAMEEFAAAYRLRPHGAIHFNVGQCRERLEDWPGAIRAYHDYLREVPEAPDRAEVRAALARIDERLAAAGLQVLLVYSEPPGAKVTLDGRERGTTPLHEVVAAGEHTLALARDGRRPVRETVAVRPGTARLIDLVLAPATADLAVRPLGGGGALPAASAPTPAPASPPGPWRRHRPALVAAGAAVALAGAAAWFGWSAREDARAIDALPAPDGAAASRHASAARSEQRTANVLWALAGGAAAVGAGLFVLEARW